jgi:hypothetical protein
MTANLRQNPMPSHLTRERPTPSGAGRPSRVLSQPRWLDDEVACAQGPHETGQMDRRVGGRQRSTARSSY